MRDQGVLEDMLGAPPGDSLPEVPRDEGVARPRPARRSAPRPPHAVHIYRRGRAGVGLAIIALLFTIGWLLNGFFTARIVAALQGSWAMGVTAHLVITAVELTTVFAAPALRAVRAPWWVYLVIWAIVLPIGVFDTLTSALGFVEWGLALGLTLGLSLHIWTTVGALVIAFLPEPMLVWLSAALLRAIRG
jgi:hypothetical protein